MILTKTNFIHFLQCPKSFWVYKNDNENYSASNFSAFMQKLVREGYEVEKYVKALFEARRNTSISYQKIFKSDDGVFARADGFDILENGEICLYEIKSSTSVKTGGDHNHIKDACFQTIAAERSGQRVDRVYIIHLNGEYIRKGKVDVESLLCIIDVTADVLRIYQETTTEIDKALELLSKSDINRNECDCLYKTKAQHCDTFEYFNPNIPKYSIYSLPRLSSKKLCHLVDEGVCDLLDVPESYELSDIQTCVLRSAHACEPQINHSAIKATLDGYNFPLYFFDYETFSSAIPIVDGIGPHKQFPVQYSLHVLEENGNLIHREYLEREVRLPDHLVTRMQHDIGPNGSIVSWHASFEKSQNNEMALMFPDRAKFLGGMNDRMVDLEDIFKLNYVDSRFEGSTSIKKVLPVICPQLSYKELDIQDGTSAMEAWKRMINLKNDESLETAKSLLKYCELDTFAMVEIYRFLKLLSLD